MNLARLYYVVTHIEYTQLPENAASYAVHRHRNTLYLYFEGSNGLTDWKNNFDFPTKPYKDMEHVWRVHRGFLRVWKTIEPQLEQTIADSSIDKIVVAGYSHGAAIAALAYEYCVFHRPDIAENIHGYGFGCPRVFWGRLHRQLRARFKNFTVIRNCKDLVTHLPPRIFGFRHVGKLLTIGAEKSYGCIQAHYREYYTLNLLEYQEKQRHDGLCKRSKNSN